MSGIGGASQRRATLLGELVAINSVNPLQAGERSGPGGEATLATRVAEQAADLGAEVELDEVEPGRLNVMARFEGTTDRVVGVDVHLDTVGVEHMTDDPFDGRIEGGRVFGRGAVDTKATLAVLLNVLTEAAAAGQRPGPTLYLIGTVGEEAGGLRGAHRPPGVDRRARDPVPPTGGGRAHPVRPRAWPQGRCRPGDRGQGRGRPLLEARARDECHLGRSPHRLGLRRRAPAPHRRSGNDRRRDRHPQRDRDRRRAGPQHHPRRLQRVRRPPHRARRGPRGRVRPPGRSGPGRRLIRPRSRSR